MHLGCALGCLSLLTSCHVTFASVIFLKNWHSLQTAELQHSLRSHLLIAFQLLPPRVNKLSESFMIDSSQQMKEDKAL